MERMRSVTPLQRIPTIEWQTNGVCNYDCSYCIQSKKYRLGQPERAALERFLAFFRSLPGEWEIKLSGGEPTASRWFISLTVPGLMDSPHQLSLLTNFSAPLPMLEQFARLTYGRLKVLSVSLHLESVTASAFMEKVLWLKPQLAPSTSVVINSVVVPGQLARLLRVQEMLREAGLKLFPQLMKTKTGVVEYAETEQPLLHRLMGERPSPWAANLAPSYQGLRCWTGVDYFVLDQYGDAFSCRTAKRFHEGYLGNVLSGVVRLRTEPVLCPYSICPCTVPVHRGMVELPELWADANPGPEVAPPLPALEV